MEMACDSVKVIIGIPMSIMNEIPLIETEELYDSIGNEATQIVDVRPIESYNGWRLRDEERGGHIPGSRSMPLKWFDYIDLPDIVESKGLSPALTTVIYGYDIEDSEKAAKLLRRLGFDDVLIYEGFLDEWSQDPGGPLDKLARFDKAVPPVWLNEALQDDKVEGIGKGGIVLCHCHYRNPEDYNLGHIPGAIELDTNSLESTETWNRRSPAELESVLTANGITTDTTVVVYGRFSDPRNDDPFPGSSEGQLGAMRCAFIMLYAGVKDVRVLNGGLQSWLDCGYELTTEPTVNQPVDDFGLTIPGRPDLAVDIEEAKLILKATDKNLVCVRSWPELIGKVSGYNYIEKKGRIPGAVFGNCGSDAYHMENYRNLDHTGREYHEIERMWEEVGITPDKHNSFYCGTGWRGSEAFFNAWLMGWPDISVFDGGWFEWSSDDSNPFETGEPEGMRIIGRIYGL